MSKLLRPIEQFWQSEARGGFILFAAALLAFIVANSPLSQGYFALQNTPFRIGFGDWSLEKPLLLWVNDLLMAVFFLLVGMEIKRELVQGELRDLRKASLTIFAALGGMVAPALIYTFFNAGGEGARGWGVPMATDIAFSLGVLALLGSRVPLGLKVFLTAFAIVDDLGAVLVIALFYTASLKVSMLLWGGLFWVLALLAGWRRVRFLPLYLLLGLLLWYFTLKSGIHATVAGVLLAMAIPITRSLEPFELKRELRAAASKDPEEIEGELEHLEHTIAQAQSPLHRLEHLLHPWVAYLILPIFAFFNAGVNLAGAQLGGVALGSFLGLLLGKPLGIFAASWLAVRLGLAALPAGVNWLMVAGAGFLGGIGFTMALFIAALAFGPGTLDDQAKVGVLSSSVVAAAVGLWVVARGVRK